MILLSFLFILVGELDLQNNFLTGSIPVLQQNKLSFIGMTNNTLTGAIPRSLFKLPKLEFLYLSNNNLSSTIPGSFGSSKRLREIWLNNNQLTGTIPTVSNFLNIGKSISCHLLVVYH